MALFVYIKIIIYFYYSSFCNCSTSPFLCFQNLTWIMPTSVPVPPLPLSSWRPWNGRITRVRNRPDTSGNSWARRRVWICGLSRCGSRIGGPRRSGWRKTPEDKDGAPTSGRWSQNEAVTMTAIQQMNIQTIVWIAFQVGVVSWTITRLDTSSDVILFL